MHSIALRILQSEEVCEERKYVRLSRKTLRDHSNPLEMYEPIFQQNYRVSKVIFKHLLDLLITRLPPTRKMFAVPPIVKLSACLHFFAEGGYQKGVGKDCEVGLAQSTFSLVLSEVLNVFEDSLCPQWITWMTTEEKRKAALYFYEKFQIPGVVGAVDGTHVFLISPSTNKHLFYNRKSAYSLNVMLVCDDDMKIRFIDAKHPGATHDSLIWNTSELRAKMEQDFLLGDNNYRLLGDAGYTLEPWLLIPYRSPREGTKEQQFNDAHSRCRNIIERVNGVLKNRWRCLLASRQLHYAPSKAVQITNVCAALHNMCITYKLGLENFNETPEEGGDQIPEESSESSAYSSEAKRLRDNIANSL